MRNIGIPEISVEEVYSLCISKVKNEDLKKRLNSCLPILTMADSEYRELAENSSLFTFEDQLKTEDIVTIDEMKKVYTSRMVGQKNPGFKFYNQLLKSAKYRTCPFCGHRKVSTLDHYLPKSLYPSFVVTPVNLVPACSTCNTGKSSTISERSEEEVLHPYFDDLGSEKFLFSTVIESVPPVIMFQIIPPESWSRLLSLRMKNHFKKFKLAELYSLHSTDEIIGQMDYWEGIEEEELKKLFIDQFESRKRKGNNSWEVALYEGLSKSNWFCAGGYKKFDE